MGSHCDINIIYSGDIGWVSLGSIRPPSKNEISYLNPIFILYLYHHLYIEPVR